MKKTLKIYGLVQGVGFRPFVSFVANRLGLKGDVRNDGGIVTVNISGEAKTIEEFISAIRECDIPGAKVERIEETFDREPLPGLSAVNEDLGEKKTGGEDISSGFRIIKSTDRADRQRLLPPDAATCDKCEAELYDPKNRRYRHPFISCTVCGPRYTIMQDIPYDRERTVMRGFALCEKCGREYEIPGDRREYAQTICCPDCGPQISGGDAAIRQAVKKLRDGGIVAIKGIGGYHLACDPYNEAAVERLRDFKNRDAKPFAVMYRNIDEIRQQVHVSDTEERLLCGTERPIVLLNIINEVPEEKGASENIEAAREAEYGTQHIPQSVLGTSNRIGAMLPCNPIQMLILDEISPLIMTSGNLGGEPIITDDEKMRSYLGKGIDYVLSHDREIVVGLDDSIIQVTRIG
ncbi:MAG: carbamoyltransferase HypF, partial [Lachnospiraceae bacterium]|nr:carbamoyltransferase HypF [Lachnospiraceae bacterium]